MALSRGALSRGALRRGRLEAGLIAAPFLIVALFPVAWAFLSSFKTLKDIVSPVPVLLFQPTVQNYVTVLMTPAVQMGLLNSMVVVSGAVALGVLLGWPAAYALARLSGRSKDELLFYVLSMRFMPPVAVAIPFMAIYFDLGLYDTRVALILTYSLVTISTVVWMSIPAFERVPREIEEAAELDGYSQLSVFWKIALPLAAPSLLGPALGVLEDRIAAGLGVADRGSAVYLRGDLERAADRAGADGTQRDAAGGGIKLQHARHGGSLGSDQRLGDPAERASLPVHRIVDALPEPLLPAEARVLVRWS